jgi:two-component system sensor histidine kinase KdpD
VATQYPDEPREGAEPLDADQTLVAPAGRFRLYLGAAAGVGKTCAMLEEGRRRRARGRDVVVGFVETHGRQFTADSLGDLEVVPRRVVEYRGGRFEEMDLAAILARNPQLAIVDELAHTNVPGSGPHVKRWEDVLEILDAGINVISTVNIQHLESLAESIEKMTGTPIRERVPDWVVRRADQTELVDSSPEQLRRRMVHGHVYAPEQVPAALTHFFSTHNLTILRDLALRFVADETEEVLLREVANMAPGSVETTERILVGVVPGPAASYILRRAARIAARVKCDFQVMHVIMDDARRAANGGELASLEELTRSLGGRWVTLHGDDVASTLMTFAIQHQVTQLVIGADRERGWGSGRSGIVRQLLRRASGAGVDVHVIARAARTDKSLAPLPSGAATPSAEITGWEPPGRGDDPAGGE